MIRPEKINWIVTGVNMSEEELIEKHESTAWYKFMKDVETAEKDAAENFIKALKDGGTAPKTIRVKISLWWSEGLIRALVENYYQAGWQNVKYDYIDEGYMGFAGYWLVTIEI